MKKILFFAKIREAIPKVGNIPPDTIKIDLDKESASDLSVPHLYTVITQKMNEFLSTNQEKFQLFIVGPNSINIAIPYILTKLGYQYEILPKPTDSDTWGFVNNEKSIYKDHHSFLHELKKTDSLFKVDCCIQISGKHSISGDKEVFFNNRDIIKTRIPHDLKIDDYSKVYTTHRLVLPENYTSLVNYEICKLYEQDINKILDELVQEKANKIHILSSIPAYGLQILGKVITKEPCRDMTFLLYDYESADKYHLVSAINTKQIQELSEEQ